MDVYSMVTERIISQLEKGAIPWKKPWAKCLDGTFNRITRKPYSLLNQLLLLHGGEYATFKQWDQIGGRVKKGEKAEIVVFWKMQDLAEKNIPLCTASYTCEPFSAALQHHGHHNSGQDKR